MEHLAAFIAKVDAEKVASREKLAGIPDVRGVEWGPDPKEGDTKARRSYMNPEGELDWKATLEHQANSTTMWEVFNKSAEKYPDNNCLGSYNNESKAFEWQSYATIRKRALNLGSGLRKLGMQPGDFIGMMLPTQLEWTLTELATWTQSLCIVTLYETYGLDAIKYIVNHSGLRVIVCLASKVPIVLDMAAALAAEGGHKLDTIAYIGELGEVENPSGITLVNWASLEEDGEKDPVEPAFPKPDDRLFIIYTSGTTGNPKGVVHVHRSMYICLASAINKIPLDSNDVHLAFLPLAHIMEQFVEGLMFINGGSIGFWGGNIKAMTEYVMALKPTAFIGVPRILNRYYDKIKGAFDAADGMKKMLIGWAMESKKQSLAKGRYLSYWDPIVFHPAAQALGGRVRFIATGSAPIEPTMLEFFRMVFSCCVVEGYGMTEVLVVSNSADYDTSTRSHVGSPYEAIEFKLQSVPDMNYLVTDKPLPRGEILIRGPQIMKEYYRNEEKTAETIDADGWLHTGDIGCFLEDGSLRILDRVKHIFKLAQGEYVAPEKLEQVFIHSKYIAQVFVNGDSKKPCLVAVVVPDPEQLPALAAELGLADLSPAELVSHADVKAAILADLETVGTAMKVNRYELIKNIHISPVEFGELGLLTPTFKLKRNVARQHFEEITQQLYEGL